MVECRIVKNDGALEKGTMVLLHSFNGGFAMVLDPEGEFHRVYSSSIIATGAGMERWT